MSRFTMKSPLRVGVVGATGLVGRQMARALERTSCPLSSVHLWATERGAGERIPFRGEDLVVENWLDGISIIEDWGRPWIPN